MTPQILLHCLFHTFVKMEMISLLIFDECHHAQVKSNHAYAEIMKVSIGYADYWRQLAIYAISLSRTSPHQDFPKDKIHFLKDPTKFNLIEYQLLRDETRNYILNENDIIEIQKYIIDSVIQMERLVNGEKYNELNPTRLETAKFPSICSRCQFKKMCWRDV